MTLVLLVLAVVLAGTPASAQECDNSFDSTFEMVQELIFERRGCTAAVCHSGPNPSGGLDLSAEVAWENLFEAPVDTVADSKLLRVTPGNKQKSLLWLNLASAVLPELWEAPLRSMPIGGAPPLSLSELELLRLWIEDGAVRTGVVPETVGLFDDVCLPPLEPLEAEPLAPPPAGVGVQIRAPRLDMPPNSETEVCFTSYYDFSDVVPAESLTEDGKFFAVTSSDRADPLTHHQTANAYQGATSIDDPIWGEFTCKHGPRTGETCDPTDPNACGEPGGCGSEPVRSVACIGYGPADAGFGSNNQFTLLERRQTTAGDEVSLVPVKSVVIWNSHSFNVTPVPGKVDRWINFEFADISELDSSRRLQQIITQDQIFQAGAPAYARKEACAGYVLPQGGELQYLSFHTHKRGARWRTFGGDFRCRGGANAGAHCSPLPVEEDVPDLCGGSPCEGYSAPALGDCDGDNLVSISDLTSGVAIALGSKSVDDCSRFDPDGNGRVTVAELVSAVQQALGPQKLDPEQALMYLSFDYADPLQQDYDPPLVLGGPASSDADRTLTYCALYDNGYSNPGDVVRASKRPTNAGRCRPTHCAEGAIGTPCSEDEHAACDSSPGAGDGLCDACSSGFGLTTDDEMFLLIGSYVVPPED